MFFLVLTCLVDILKQCPLVKPLKYCADFWELFYCFNWLFGLLINDLVFLWLWGHLFLIERLNGKLLAKLFVILLRFHNEWLRFWFIRIHILAHNLGLLTTRSKTLSFFGPFWNVHPRSFTGTFFWPLWWKLNIRENHRFKWAKWWSLPFGSPWMTALYPNLMEGSFSLWHPFLAAGSFAAPWSFRLLVALNTLISDKEPHLFLTLLHLAL